MIEIAALTKELNQANVELEASRIKLDGMDEYLRLLREKQL